jgi:hypothetical protein
MEQYLTSKGVTRDCWKRSVTIYSLLVSWPVAWNSCYCCRVTELSIAAFGEADPAPSLSLNSGGNMETGGDEEGKEADNLYPEPEVDDMRAARDAALGRYVQEMERKREMVAKMNRAGAKDKERERERADNLH